MALKKFFSKGRNVKKLRRSRDIVSVLFKYGFLVDNKRKISLKKNKESETSKLTRPEKLRLALEELGPTFIKLGQILSVRPDLLPLDYIKELEKLQDEVCCSEEVKIDEIFKDNFGKSIDEIFISIETTPFASASLSQVYKAQLKNGDWVAIKVQKPNVKEIINTDLAILTDLANLSKIIIRDDWVFQPPLIVSEIKRSLTKEINFVLEGLNYERFSENFKNIKYVKIPKVYWQYTNTEILTMEYIDAIKMKELFSCQCDEYDKKEIADRGARIALKQIFEDGFFHADPHPANILVKPPSTIVMIDVGMVGALDLNTRKILLNLLNAFINEDIDAIITCFKKLNIIKHEDNKLDEAALKRDLFDLIDKYFGMPLKYFDFKEISQELFRTVYKYNLSLPPDLTLMLKAISTVENTGKQLDPYFDIYTTIESFIKENFIKKLSPSYIFNKSKKTIAQSVDILENLPNDIFNFINKIKDQDSIKIRVDKETQNKITKSIKNSVLLISLSIIMAAVIISASVFIIYNQKNWLIILGLFTTFLIVLVLLYKSIFKN
ncbi:MAG TPA: AarF/ABC1/UbiB kinase family protein [Bacteroidales bacterium]|nr:AarF/ABC1/UbiB kinase family protein [Bacteroidales bacterium]